MAKGSFLVAREGARVMIDQAMGGDIVYVCSKNALVAGPNNLAYGSAKADQAHQVRLLAAELGEHRIRVNGVNPDGVVRGSGIFAKGWGAQRAAVYGVPEEELGAYLRGADPSEARGAPRRRGRRRVRADGRRSRLDHGAAGPGGRRSAERLPALIVPVYAAIDLGATSGRVVNVLVERDRVELDLVRRFPTVTMTGPDGTLIWDVDRLLDDVRSGLVEACRRARVASVAVDGWGVDYGFVDAAGERLGTVHAYRSTRTGGVMETVVDRLGRRRIYGITGIQFLPFNTIYQLVASLDDAGYLAADRLLMVPDLVNHVLCGSTTNDVTNASTTQLLDVDSRCWSHRVGRSPRAPAGPAPRSPRAGHCSGSCARHRSDRRWPGGRGGRQSRHGQRRRRHTAARRWSRRLHLVRDVVARGLRDAGGGDDAIQRSKRTSPTSSVSTERSAC